VADELTTLYLNENLTSRTQRAAQTSTFFSEEADRQQAQILELDKRLSEFKQKNEERLPELSQLNHQISDRTEQDVRDAENRIGAIDSQKVLLEAQLAQIAPSSTVMSDSGQRILSTQDRLKALKSQLAEYKAVTRRSIRTSSRPSARSMDSRRRWPPTTIPAIWHDD